MEALLGIRKTIKDFFDRYDLFLLPCLKFLLAFFSFVMINRSLPYMDVLSNVFILVILALLCAILPVNSIAIVGIVLMILQCFGASLIIGLAALVFFILAIILLLRFVPSEMLGVILTPFAFALGIPAVIPVGMGMLRGRSCVAAGIGGVAVYCFLSNVPEVANAAAAGKLSAVETIQMLIKAFTGHKELILSCIVFSAVILIVNLIRKMVTYYTYLFAVLIGCAFYLILHEVSRRLLDIDGSFSKELIGVLISAAICLVIAFFIHSADYKRTQILQFEDDEYYYYVKAVPKRTPDTQDEYEEEDEEEDYYDDLAEDADDGFYTDNEENPDDGFYTDNKENPDDSFYTVNEEIPDEDDSVDPEFSEFNDKDLI